MKLMHTPLVLAFALIALLPGGIPLAAQELPGQGPLLQHSVAEAPDTSRIQSVKELFTRGRVEGHVRNFFMTTQNYRSLSDNYANAIGAGIHFQTASYRGFRMGFAGLFTYKLFSSDINQRDPISEKHPRLELELFDIEDPENGTDLDRLDQLYLAYRSDRLEAKLGRFSFSSPLMNPQDGRMKPYSFQGVHLQLPLQETQGMLHLAWFDHVSPRSTVSWFGAGESIGIFSPGVDEQGNPSGYRHHTSSRGVGVAGLQLNPHRQLNAQAWNYWIDNISNNSYGRAVAEVLPGFKAGVEGLYQFQMGQGGNPESSLAYFPDQRQWLAGGMLAYAPASWQLSLNYLHIGGGGRFLFPREWGREQFFATLPRGRMEGSGRSDLLVLKARRQWSNRISVEAAIAKSWLPAPTDHRFNKYGALQYWGWMADVHYKPAKPVLEGLSFRLLYVGRSSPDAGIPLKDMYYNTNFHNLNFVSQISF